MEMKQSLTLVLASDTHDRHAELAIPDGDIFIHAGDFTMAGDPRAIAAFGKWLRALPHRYKIVIAGNHDFAFEHAPERAREALGVGWDGVIYDGLIYLEDSGVTINGITFWGSPWQPWFYDWAFNLRRGPELAAKWALIPTDTDVLITHGPPHGVLDVVRDEHVGCAELMKRLGSLNPRLHVFGHIHEGAGQEGSGSTIFVNASICDAQYNVGHAVQVVSI
jgi:predicted phosphohydrolase